MISYKLNGDGSYAHKIIDNLETGSWYRTDIDEDYLASFAEGNTPLPPDEPEETP